MTSPKRQKPSFIESFGRSQVSSFLATIFDYGALFLCVEVFHVWYVIATAIGAFIGAVTNFLINRHWSFEADHMHWGPQVTRYIIVSAGSLLLNTGGVWAVTEYIHFHYAISVAAVSLLVGFLYNFPLHRHYVYRHD